MKHMYIYSQLADTTKEKNLHGSYNLAMNLYLLATVANGVTKCCQIKPLQVKQTKIVKS